MYCWDHGKLGEDLRKVITQNINYWLTKILSLENKVELYNKKTDSAHQIFDKIMEKIWSIEHIVFEYVPKPISLPKKHNWDRRYCFSAY